MSTKTDKLWHIILEIVTPILLNHAKEFGEEFGIMSVTSVVVSSDYSYADVTVASSEWEKQLPKFLAPLAIELRRLIWKQVSTRKIPHIRFKVTKGQAEVNRVYEILSEIERTYDLSQPD
jgi:ribosome-binding factor A